MSCAFYERTSMSDSNAPSREQRIAALVHRSLAEHSIDRVVGADEDLRQAGLSSLDMVSLVLFVEEEFGLMVPESGITPANFRSIAAISRLVGLLQAAE
jgi:acyl carrier protein